MLEGSVVGAMPFGEWWVVTKVDVEGREEHVVALCLSLPGNWTAGNRQVSRFGVAHQDKGQQLLCVPQSQNQVPAQENQSQRSSLHLSDPFNTGSTFQNDIPCP
jgi:hypothetical protein